MTGHDDFIARYGGIYEHSPWGAQQAWKTMETGADLAAVMRKIVDEAGPERQLALLRAHPDLAGKAALSGALTADSTAEQQSAGLDHCSPAEFEELQHLNEQYHRKFGFPFIIAVRGLTRTDILRNFRARVKHSPADEFQTALIQVHKIAKLRLGEMEGNSDD